MAFNQFTNLDFEDLRSQIKDYLRSNSNFTDFDFEGSNFSILIDILAYNSYITAYNTNMAVNESFIDSASLRENVVSLARNIGYVPRSKRSSKGKISFTVDTGNPDLKTVTLKAGSVALGAIQGGNYIFSIPEDITVSVDNFGIASFTNIDVYEGVYLTKRFSIDNSQPNQKFVIPNTSVDISTIRVFVRNKTTEEYKLYNNIFNIDKNSKIFLVQEVEDEKYEIVFGDNVLGKKPISGSLIEVGYIVTNGAVADGAFNFTFSGILVDNRENKITTGISQITTVQRSENGDDIETLDSIKYLAPRVYASQYRAVTANDYKGLIPYIFPNVESVSAYGGDELDPPEYGKVFISIKPRQGKFISEISKNEIKKKLKQYSIAGIKPEIVDLKYLYIELVSNVYYNKSTTSDVNFLQTKIYDTLKEFGSSYEINNFGGRFKYSKLCSLIDNTSDSITSNISKVVMRRDLQPQYNKLATYELCFGNQFHIKKNNFEDNRGYNIKSTGFTIDGVSGTVYMSDVPINDNMGTLFLFTLKENIPVIINKNAGKVDYIKGEIMTDIINITSSSNPEGIQIQAVPESNDIIAFKDIYLELSIQNTVVNMIEDTISSGENTSATTYITSSSYTNGEYTR
jgi:hypothetical protein